MPAVEYGSVEPADRNWIVGPEDRERRIAEMIHLVRCGEKERPRLRGCHGPAGERELAYVGKRLTRAKPPPRR